MKILAVGGGSGGHVTPAVAVLDELKQRDDAIEVRFWCDKGFADQARQILEPHDYITLQIVAAGKFRRYHHLTLLQHLLIPSIVFLNLRDLFLIMAGFIQSVFRLLMWRPDVVFTKGGFVCLPVGWAASLLRIPLVIHDSDVVPGLTNRLLAGRATTIGTGAPLENYPSYDMSKSRYVGIPISSSFKPYDDMQRTRIKRELGFDTHRPLVVVVGGGLGAAPINNAVVANREGLLALADVYLLSGKLQYDELRKKLPEDDTRLQLHAFVATGLVDVLGAADVVVSRAGATALLELAALHKPTVLIPSSRLVWQVKHAEMFAREQAVVLLDETKFEHEGDTSLLDAVTELVESPDKRHGFARRIAEFAMPQAAMDMADMVEAAAKQ